MAATIEDRVARLEARVDEVEERAALSLRPWYAVTVEEARKLAELPVERGGHEFEQLRRIFNRFSGPEDLSDRMREYRYRDRE